MSEQIVQTSSDAGLAARVRGQLIDAPMAMPAQTLEVPARPFGLWRLFVRQPSRGV